MPMCGSIHVIGIGSSGNHEVVFYDIDDNFLIKKIKKQVFKNLQNQYFEN